MFDGEAIRKYLSEPKMITTTPNWNDTGGYHECELPLQIGGIGVEGLFLRIKSPQTVDGYGFMVQIELKKPSRGTERLERIDWKAGHQNPNSGPPELRLETLRSTHFHSFELNYLSDTRRMRAGNLPIARMIEPDPTTIEELLAVCEDLLIIEGLTHVRRPPTQTAFAL